MALKTEAGGAGRPAPRDAGPRGEVVLEVAGLRKRYGEAEVVAGIDLAIARGECFGVLGPNGAGKTTTLRLCLGLIAPDAGSIRVLGEPIPRRAREARHRIGVVPQMDNLDPDFTVAENLVVYGRYFGMADAAIRARIPELLDFAGLAQRADTRIQTLSGGMKRRLTLARALVNDPELIFLDEPTTGLDPQARHVIWDRLRQLIAQGRTIVLTTHFMEEAERLCARLVIMDQGRIIAHGSPAELIEQHVEPHVVEVHGDGLEQWAERHAARLAGRCERSGDTLFCYAADAAPVVADLAARPGLRYLHRRASLEDVFLKLTGRELRD
jgi:lipooligosaccharide transport system ATP-binding protein